MGKKIMQAKTTAMIEFEGRRVVIKQGISTAHEDHGVVTEHPELWREQEVMYATEDAETPPREAVETATAPPGERRSVHPTRRGKRTTGTSGTKEGSDS